MKRVGVAAVGCLFGLLASGAIPRAQTVSTDETQQPEQPQQAAKRSPWLAVPLVATNPKLGTTVGGLGAYLHYFDPDSQVSMFGAAYQYSTTHSSVGGVFARTSFHADHHRIVAFAGFGYIENEYQDYLGSGQTFKTTDDLHAVAGRYLSRVTGHWFVGGQAAFANYLVKGATPTDDQILETLGITGFTSGGLGGPAGTRR